ncbi:MAG: HesA/MoeB/ThiF family protein [Candidatus Binatia bacterium]
MLSDSQIDRYSRQIILPQVGGKGQEKLLHARVLVNGSGLVQSTALLYLAAAGVGTIGVRANTSHALLSALAIDQGDAPSAVLSRLNPDCTIIPHTVGEAPEELAQQYDLVLSTPDPLHEVCYALRKPFLSAHVSSGEAWLFCCRGYEPDQACLRCVPALTVEAVGKPSLPASLTALFLGTLQATEAMKLVLGLDQPSRGKLWRCQFPGLHFYESMVKKDPACLLCGQLVFRNHQSL